MWFLQLFLLLGLGLVLTKNLFVKGEGYDVVAPSNGNDFPSVVEDYDVVPATIAKLAPQG